MSLSRTYEELIFHLRYVQGVLATLRVSQPSGVTGSPSGLGAGAENASRGPSFGEQEQRVWAGVFSACLAHGACTNAHIDPRRAAGKAYEAVLALRRLPEGAAYHFPDGWVSAAPVERCRARESGGVQCELTEGHDGPHQCPQALREALGPQQG